MSNKQNDSIWEGLFNKHFQEQLKKFKDPDQAELEAHVLTDREIEEME